MGDAQNCGRCSPATGQEAGHFALVKAGVLGLIFVLATFSNVLCCARLWKRRRRNSRTQLFLLHLCFADLVVAFFQVLPQVSMEITQRFRGSDIVCRSVKYLQVFGMFASPYMIVAMTIDRYRAVCAPMVSFLTGSFRRHVAISAVWLISLAFSVPQLFIFSLREVETNVYDCWATFIEPWGGRIYITWITLAVFVLPAVILLYCQINICTGIYFNMKKKALQAVTSDGRHCSKGVSSAIPFFVVQLWSAWSPNSAPTTGPVFVTIMLLASLNSCTNPWIYLYYC
uniref:G-protein coupled receptors family 1 profile domain-containing protein n=1 Tax=Electrophorus electricus TaxID=8005 RepID=A0AAY5EML4_ELEEL